ncbi:hypothetical protein K5V21_02435 [Clostridium sardiniense]|uniref:PspA/IM30 family protein n=1 Tax=Clostridium sardiniense TaxID=29369 RepID=A0ABS7KU20_CLOSR|nr:hypothetical protein [Clostridium sardiniense]MBY0754304.1 hypothetical protein [Clostridium sardiniense]MDQ0461036.1 hypothetical protein [Clostridium sardiniense]
MLFKNIKNMTESIGKNVSDLANTIAVTTREQDKINIMEKEIKCLNLEIKSVYAEIGERFVEHKNLNNEIGTFNVDDVLNTLDSKIAKREELKAKVVEASKELNDKLILQEKKKVKEQFESEKEKLDKALAMDIINKDEYLKKLKVHENKVIYFDEIKNIEKQYEIKIISYDEKNEKIKSILDRDE